MKKIIFTLIVVIFFLLASYSVFLFFTYDGDSDFLKIDSCLDRGGRWEYDLRSCITHQPL